MMIGKCYGCYGGVVGCFMVMREFFMVFWVFYGDEGCFMVFLMVLISLIEITQQIQIETPLYNIIHKHYS